MNTTSTAASVGIIGGADGPTAIFVTGSEGSLDIDSIKGLLDGFDPATLLPDLSKVFDSLAPLCRIAVMIGPLVLLALGLAYLFLSPKEANYYFGYRCYFGMGSVQAWRFTQRLSGIVLGGLGVILTGVALVISGKFPGMDINDMVWLALKLLIIEGVLAVLANAAIGITAMARFDRKGEYRNKKK